MNNYLPPWRGQLALGFALDRNVRFHPETQSHPEARGLVPRPCARLSYPPRDSLDLWSDCPLSE